MTEQETYIQGQKASGIEVGDTVRVMREFKLNEKGCGLSCMTGGDYDHSIGNQGIVLGITSSGNVDVGGIGYSLYHPWFVLEIVKKADGSVPDMTPAGMVRRIEMANVEIANKCMELITTKGEQSMKTQEIYSVVVTENEHVKDAETSQIIATKKRVIFSKGDLPAFGPGNATVKAVLAAGKVKGVNAIKDEDEVEVKVSSPFRG